MENNFVLQETGTTDRRQRLLYLTDKGTALENQLTSLQGKRFARAYREAGVDAVEGFQRVLRGLVDQSTRDQIDSFDDKPK
jgi:DNA-binding MarR family transcriptional regulator